MSCIHVYAINKQHIVQGSSEKALHRLFNCYSNRVEKEKIKERLSYYRSKLSPQHSSKTWLHFGRTESATFENTIILFVSPSRILHKHCFHFLLGLTMLPIERKSNTYAKFWRDKQRVLWYFWKWSIEPFNSSLKPDWFHGLEIMAVVLANVQVSSRSPQTNWKIVKSFINDFATRLTQLAKQWTILRRDRSSRVAKWGEEPFSLLLIVKLSRLFIKR